MNEEFKHVIQCVFTITLLCRPMYVRCLVVTSVLTSRRLSGKRGNCLSAPCCVWHDKFRTRIDLLRY